MISRSIFFTYKAVKGKFLGIMVPHLFVGEGSEEIGNMIQNYIKEIEELRSV